MVSCQGPFGRGGKNYFRKTKVTSLLTEMLNPGFQFPEPYTRPLQYQLYLGLENITGAEIRVITDFLGSMLQMDPRDRLSPQELRKHRWLSESKMVLRNNPCLCGHVT